MIRSRVLPSLLLLLRRPRKQTHRFQSTATTSIYPTNSDDRPKKPNVSSTINQLVSEDKPNVSSTINQLAALSKPQLPLIIGSISTLSLTSSVTLLFPYFAGTFLDAAISDPAAADPFTMCAGLFGLTCAAGAGVSARTYMLTIASERIVSKLRKRLYEAILSQPQSFFHTNKTGDLITRLSADAHLVRQTMTTDLVSALRSTFMATGGTVMILSSSPYLAAFSLCSLPPIFLFAKYFGTKIKARQSGVQDRLSDSTALAGEVIGGMTTVRSFSAENHHIIRYGDAIDDIYSSAISAGKQSSLFDGCVHIAANASALAVLAAGGSMVLKGSMTSGQLASFMMYERRGASAKCLSSPN